jgi:uncharacterized protein (TIGR00297 family)
VQAWLSPAGIVAAIAVGAAVLAGTGWRGLAVLGAFFVTGSLLAPGGGRRRARQVLANGGAAVLCALFALGDARFGAGVAGAIAAAAADTWSTEIGLRSATTARLLTTFRPVPAGTSGGVSLAGTLGGMAGAATIALLATLIGLVPARLAGWVALAGMAGALADSVLGATLQARWRCPGCGREREQAAPCHGSPVLAGGLPWMTNDAVNALATLLGAVIALLPVLGEGWALA